MNKKRKDRVATTHPDGTTALTSRLNPDVEEEDDDRSPLSMRTRSSERDVQVPRLEAVESGTSGFSRAKERGVLEEDVDVASNRAAGFDAASASRIVGPDGSGFGAFQEYGSLFGQISDPNDLIQNFPVSSGELRDAKRMMGATVGTLFRGGGFIANFFDSVFDGADLDVSGTLKVANMLLQQCKYMYDHAILRLRGELSCHEKEHNKVSSKLQNSEACGAQGDKELGELRASLEAALREKAALVAQLKDKVDELGQLWGKVGKANHEFTELQARVSAHSEAKERAQSATSVLEVQIQAAHMNDSTQAKMITRLSFELSMAKTEVENVQAEVVMNNTMAEQKMSAHSRSVAAIKDELKKALDRANNKRECERCRSHRETPEEIHARGFDLSKEIGQAKGEECDAKFLISDDEDDEEETAGP
ncbi:COP1-interactive protein 1-like [Nicotiana sylvestris]|uniref:COP1-interactive protein 1-like n=1 Tax=Nicotiana sylvestris TaxID=4096 RepID=UPI00388CD445